MESCHDEEVSTSSLPKQYQELAIIDFTVAVKISLVDHFLNVDLVNIGVGVHQLFDVLFV